MASQESIITRRADFERPNPDRIRTIGTIPSSMLGDAMGRRRGLGPAIRPMTSHCKFSGPALTIRCVSGEQPRRAGRAFIDPKRRCGRHRLQSERRSCCYRRQLRGIGKGKGCGGESSPTVWSGISMSWQESAIPVFGAGVSPNGPFKNGAGEIGFDVALGQVVVRPGDVLVGDQDGIVCVPHDRVDDAIERAVAVQQRETEMSRQRVRGVIPRWLEEQIASIAVIDVP